MSATTAATTPGANAPGSSNTAASQSTNVSAAPTSLSDQLLSSVPKLDPTGLNCAIFSVHFQDAVEAKGFWDHFDGAETCPVAANLEEPTNDEETIINQWRKNERSAKSLLTQKLRDSALMRVHSKPTVKERWDAIATMMH